MLANSLATVSNDLSMCKAGTTCDEKRGPRYALAGEIVRTADVSLMPTPSLRCVVGNISGSITDLNGMVKSMVQKPHESRPNTGYSVGHGPER